MERPTETIDAGSWSTLLAGWTQVAQSAVALPKDEQGDRWRASIAPAIALHAIAMALEDLHRLDASERSLAMDKSELSIKTHASDLNQTWGAEPMPGSLLELVDDAKAAWEDALHEGVVWTCAKDPFVSRHPGEVGLALREAGFAGEVFIAQPGVAIGEGAPVAWTRDPSGGMPDEEVVEFVHGFLGSCDGKASDPTIMRPIHQVYRQFDFLGGGAGKDLVVPLTADLPGGQPLLVPVIVGGEIASVPLPSSKGSQRVPVPVEWTTDERRDGS